MTGRRRHHRLLLLAGALLAAQAVHGQTPPDAGAAAPAPAPPYQDREIEGLAPEPTDEGETYASDTTGWPRFLRLETRLGTQPFDERRSTQVGFALYGLMETPNHGTLSVDGNVAPRHGRGTLTVRQRGLPLHGGWQGNHELGVINSPAPAITRLPSRVHVPSTTLLGVSGEWINPSQGWQLQASAGSPGRLEGLPASGFTRLSGQRTTVGVQWRAPSAGDGGLNLTGRGWSVALQHENARGVSTQDAPSLPSDGVDANATLLAVRHEGDKLRVQAQALTNEASNVSSSRSAFWIDGEWDEGPWQHGAGLYRLAPQLTWAQQPLASDVAGAYLRSSWTTRQWSTEGSIDWLRTLSRRTGNGVYATASARWRLGRGSSVGVGAALRRFDGNAWSGYGDWRWPNAWGSSGLRLALSDSADRARAQVLTWDQDWQVPLGWNLSTSLGLGRSGAQPDIGQAADNLWSAALNLGAPLGARANLRANLNTEHSSLGNRRWGANLGAQWRIDPRWSLEANFNRSSGRSLVGSSLDPLAPPLSVVSTASDRSFYAVLRYELQAGSRNAPLGGQPLEGGGRIAGTVYFDTNRSGTQEASEAGVAGVSVYLDNRYATRTDAQGRFEFPFVAAGPRTVTVRNETLPLPWNVVDEGQVKVDVRLRETTELTIPVHRTD